jgi:hypothetical protein
MNEATSPAPTVEAEFHVEPHPDPVIQGFIVLVQALRAEIARLKKELHGPDTR